MAAPVGDGASEIGYWREALASEAQRPAATHGVEPDDLVQEALVAIWKGREGWRWPPEPSRLAKFLHRMARDMAAKARAEARRRSRPRRPRKPAQVPPLCDRLRELVARVRKPPRCSDIVLHAAMAIAPAELPRGRFREAELAWRRAGTLNDIARMVGARQRVVRKRLVRASEALERSLLDAFRSFLSAGARRSLDTLRRAQSLPEARLDELAEEVATILDLRAEDDEGRIGTQPGQDWNR